jgi:hypothetical protein
MGKVTTYGLGGFDPTKPNNNIVDEVEVDDPAPVEDLAAASHIDELYGLVADLYAQTGVDAAPLLESKTVSETAKSAALAVEAVRGRADGDLFEVEDTETKPVERIELDDA